VITATSEGKTGTATVTVTAPLGFGSSTEKIRVVDIGSTFSPTLSGATAASVTFESRATSIATVDAQGKITGVAEGQVWIAATGAASSDSVYVIVPRTTTGPVLRSDLTSFNVKAGATTVINVILDTRSTTIGGAELIVGIQSNPPVFGSVTYSVPTGSPTPVVNNSQSGILRVSLASASGVTGIMTILTLTVTTPTAGASGFITLTLNDLVSTTGADLLPVSTSTRIPIIVQ
jgi:hypothetical protein